MAQSSVRSAKVTPMVSTNGQQPGSTAKLKLAGAIEGLQAATKEIKTMMALPISLPAPQPDPITDKVLVMLEHLSSRNTFTSGLSQPPMPEPIWYHGLRGGKTTDGPVTEQQLRGLLQAGRLNSNALVWCDAPGVDWRPLSQVLTVGGLVCWCC
jgi:hypothetical protein